MALASQRNHLRTRSARIGPAAVSATICCFSHTDVRETTRYSVQTHAHCFK